MVSVFKLFLTQHISVSKENNRRNKSHCKVWKVWGRQLALTIQFINEAIVHELKTYGFNFNERMQNMEKIVLVALNVRTLSSVTLIKKCPVSWAYPYSGQHQGFPQAEHSCPRTSWYHLSFTTHGTCLLTLVAQVELVMKVRTWCQEHSVWGCLSRWVPEPPPHNRALSSSAHTLTDVSGLIIFYLSIITVLRCFLYN